MIFLGEVRDSETAVETLKASINGRLVICTTHGSSVVGVIERIYALSSSLAGSDDSSQMLSRGLLGVVHQSLRTTPKGVSVMADCLWLGDESAAGIRSNILQRKFNQLESFVDLQRYQVKRKI